MHFFFLLLLWMSTLLPFSHSDGWHLKSIKHLASFLNVTLQDANNSCESLGNSFALWSDLEPEPTMLHVFSIHNSQEGVLCHRLASFGPCLYSSLRSRTRLSVRCIDRVDDVPQPCGFCLVPHRPGMPEMDADGRARDQGGNVIDLAH